MKRFTVILSILFMSAIVGGWVAGTVCWWLLYAMGD